jgi:hypothetical protein
MVRLCEQDGKVDELVDANDVDERSPRSRSTVGGDSRFVPNRTAIPSPFLSLRPYCTRTADAPEYPPFVVLPLPPTRARIHPRLRLWAVRPSHLYALLQASIPTLQTPINLPRPHHDRPSQPSTRLCTAQVQQFPTGCPDLLLTKCVVSTPLFR